MIDAPGTYVLRALRFTRTKNMTMPVEIIRDDCATLAGAFQQFAP